ALHPLARGREPGSGGAACRAEGNRAGGVTSPAQRLKCAFGTVCFFFAEGSWTLPFAEANKIKMQEGLGPCRRVLDPAGGSWTLLHLPFLYRAAPRERPGAP